MYDNTAIFPVFNDEEIRIYNKYLKENKFGVGSWCIGYDKKNYYNFHHKQPYTYMYAKTLLYIKSSPSNSSLPIYPNNR